MKCPKCGSEMKFKDKATDGETPEEFEAMRIYKCLRCGYLVQSSEIVTAHNISYSTLR